MELMIAAAALLVLSPALIGIAVTGRPTLRSGLPYGWWKPRLPMFAPLLVVTSLTAGMWIGTLIITTPITF